MELAKCIDHTLLRTDARKEDLDKLLTEAKAYRFASVCVSPIRVAYAAHRGRMLRSVPSSGSRRALHRPK